MKKICNGWVLEDPHEYEPPHNTENAGKHFQCECGRVFLMGSTESKLLTEPPVGVLLAVSFRG